jgi:hypothetical protein
MPDYFFKTIYSNWQFLSVPHIFHPPSLPDFASQTDIRNPHSVKKFPEKQLP